MENEFKNLISLESLFGAWDKFKKNKGYRWDVMEFEFRVEENIINLQKKLRNKTYKHKPYKSFYITDPKQRHIRKAVVEDRIVHHLIFEYLNEVFEPGFIFDSYSCRKGKGSHKGINRLRRFLEKESKNNTRTCWVLKCDIKKFFDSVSHPILIGLIEKKVSNKDVLWLIWKIVDSSPYGIPIGNITSQLFANIYMNEFDQYIKYKLKAKYYLRYTDDSIFVNHNKETLIEWLKKTEIFLNQKLKLSLHPQKIIFRKYHQGVDFLGYVQFPHHRIVRTKTKRRILKKIKEGVSHESLQSYLGVLSHADSHKLSEEMKNLYWFYRNE